MQSLTTKSILIVKDLLVSSMKPVRQEFPLYMRIWKTC